MRSHLLTCSESAQLSTFPAPDRPRRLAHVLQDTFYQESTCMFTCVQATMKKYGSTGQMPFMQIMVPLILILLEHW